jgi:hypothetical protein
MASVIPLLAESSWAPAALSIIGVLIGALAAIGGGAFAQWFTRQMERQALAAALAGEIQCVVDARNWHDARKDIEQGKAIPVDERAFPIFEANLAKIGLLPVDLVGKVSVFYSELGGVFQDFRTLWVALIEGKSIANVDHIRVRLLNRMDAVEEKAKVLLVELKKEAARSWQYYLQPTE